MFVNKGIRDGLLTDLKPMLERVINGKHCLLDKHCIIIFVLQYSSKMI